MNWRNLKRHAKNELLYDIQKGLGGVAHGMAWISGVWVTYDYPGAANFTTLIGINDLGNATGMYIDSNGVTHCLLLRVSPAF